MIVIHMISSAIIIKFRSNFKPNRNKRQNDENVLVKAAASIKN